MANPGIGDIVRLRASGLSLLFDDSLLWKARHLDGLNTPTYGRSHLGTAVHFATAAFDLSVAEGKPDIEAAVAAFKGTLNDDEKVSWTDIPKQQALSIGTHLTVQYCEEISPQFHWVAIETACEPVELTMPNGVIFEITGTVDRIYQRDEKHGIVDLKTGYAVINAAGDVNVAKHGPQLATYELLEMMASRTTGLKIELPSVVIGLSTNTSGQIKWQEISHPRTLLFGDEDNMGYLIAAAHIIGSQLYIGNPRSMLCTPKYCPLFDNCFYRLGEQE